MTDRMDKIFIPETVWPCWAYALKLIGKSEYLTAQWIHNKMPKILQEFTQSKTIQSGDILVWKNKEPYHRCFPVGFIDEKIIWSAVKYEYHAAVYEGCVNDVCLVSDMVVNDGADVIPFVIRMRPLNEITTPNFLLQYSADWD